MFAASRRSRLLIVGRYAHCTGLARVARGLAQTLCKSPQNDLDVKVIPLDSGESLLDPFEVPKGDIVGDIYGTQRLRQAIKSYCPEVVLLINDISVLSCTVTEEIRKNSTAIFCAYTPIDGHLSSSLSYAKQTDLFDALICYTEFGRNAIVARQPQLTEKTFVILHAIDHHKFFPYRDKQEPFAGPSLLARRQLFGDDKDQAFIVLNANRNQERKQLQTTISGFADFCKKINRTDAYLYLHCEPKSSYGINVYNAAHDFGVRDRLLTGPYRTKHPAASDELLNQIYNACDIGINTSWGEGWGLVSCEHAAVGAAQIVPKSSACEELWQDAGELLPTISSDGMIMSRAFVNTQDVAEILHRLYKNLEYRKLVAKRCWTRANTEAWNWNHVGKSWRNLFLNLSLKQKHIEVSLCPSP